MAVVEELVGELITAEPLTDVQSHEVASPPFSSNVNVSPIQIGLEDEIPTDGNGFTVTATT